MSRIFLDTNFFVYASDNGSPAKRLCAEQKWETLLTSPDSPVISTQILQEYFNILTRKLHLNISDAREKVVLLRDIETVLLDSQLILAAIDLHASQSLSFWDALVVAAAQSAQCDEVWSEDLQSGRSFGHLRIVNPFAGI
jgi:predicted nucleic acid-binding protein